MKLANLAVTEKLHGKTHSLKLVLLNSEVALPEPVKQPKFSSHSILLKILLEELFIKMTLNLPILVDQHVSPDMIPEQLNYNKF